MVRLSVWQWDRHLEKIALIEHLVSNLRLPVVDITSLTRETNDWQRAIFRRVKLSGHYDFEREILLRNRRLDGRSGSHVITPLQVAETGEWVLVDRGFIPLGRESRDARRAYQKPAQVELFGLVKESMRREIFSPDDPDVGLDKPWADAWLRVNIPQIQKQLPYQVLPVYVEVMPNPNDPNVKEEIVRESDGGRQDVLVYSGQKQVQNFGMDAPEGNYPIPTHDTTTPPDIHLGYVYEWAFLALLTLGIGTICQMRRPRNRIEGDSETPTNSQSASRNEG